MRKIVSKKVGLCPICGKKGTIKIWDIPMGKAIGECVHGYITTPLKIMGQYVREVNSCMIFSKN